MRNGLNYISASSLPGSPSPPPVSQPRTAASSRRVPPGDTGRGPAAGTRNLQTDTGRNEDRHMPRPNGKGLRHGVNLNQREQIT